MFANVKKLLIPVFAASVAVGGLSYAAVDSVISPDDPSQDTSSLDVGDGELLTQDDGSESDDADTEFNASGVSRITSTAAGCPEGFSGNHGQFVRGTEERPRHDAARSDCGKPVQSVENRDDDGEDDGGTEGAPESDERSPSKPRPDHTDRGNHKGHAKHDR